MAVELHSGTPVAPDWLSSSSRTGGKQLEAELQNHNNIVK